MSKFPPEILMISPLAAMPTVLGCGVLPAGQTSTRTFTISNFTLPVAMVYIGKPKVSAQVFDILERDGRSALLPEAIISGILGQLTGNIVHEPMECQAVVTGLTGMVGYSIINALMMSDQKCIIVGNTVIGICAPAMPGGNGGMCSMPQSDVAAITPVPQKSPQTTNDVGELADNDVASCDGQSCWDVMSSPFGSNFFPAVAAVGGN
ncbi:hypothetical protein KIN20_030636 [Parelaphostrongylus tenuis]|uniref:Uncharacterized protein n=1 Tax=Parelaphostrongylus tenuis TaxID=148309 RepID=A0AAD5R446_PARTN|nr:hypothetical protein KIN20_030636 [Parelaphostrongylus tenuis]